MHERLIADKLAAQQESHHHAVKHSKHTDYASPFHGETWEEDLQGDGHELDRMHLHKDRIFWTLNLK